MATLEEWLNWCQEQVQEHPIATTVTILFLLVNAFIFIWWHHPLYGKNVGPTTYPLLGALPSLMRNAHRMLDFLADEIRKTPTGTIRIVRPGGHVIYSTANVDNVEYILKARFENFPKGDYIGGMLADLLGKGIFNVDGNLWKLQRKLASHEFTSRSLREFGFECAEKELQDRLIPLLFQASQTGNTVDLQDIFLRFSFDNICQLGFGVDPDCLEPTLPTVKFAEAFDKAMECTIVRFRMIPILMSFKTLFNLGSEKELQESVSVVNKFAQGVIQARREEFQESRCASRQDLLSRFMRFTDSTDHEVVFQSELEQKCMNDLNLTATESKAKVEASDVFLRDIVISFVLAGRDTTSAGLAWFFHALNHNPHVEAKLYDEIKHHLHAQQRDDASKPLGHLFSFEELKKMHYLHAAIHEALRLFPPVPLDTKEAARDDVLPDGTCIREGERVTYNIFAMARMPNIWGPDCDEFKPERWLKDGVFVPESTFKFATFQAGPRICLGKELAILQMKLIVSSLVYHFTFTALETNPPKAYVSLVFRMINGYPVIVHPEVIPCEVVVLLIPFSLSMRGGNGGDLQTA